MIPDVSYQFETGVRRFGSTKELRLYLKKLLEAYQKTTDTIDFITAEFLREGSSSEAAQSKGWFKVDELFINKTDQTRAGLDILFQVIREATPKIRLVENALIAFDKFESFAISDDIPVLLYLREGIPVRIVVGEVTKGPTEEPKKP